MNSTTSPITSRLAAPAAMATSAALAVSGIIQIFDEQSSQSTSVGIEHVGLAGFTVMVLALIPVALHLGRLAGGSRGGGIASVGLAALGAISIVSNVRGEDPSFFAAVAAPANLLWLVGFTMLAVALKRNGRVPAAIALGLPVSWFFMLPLSMVGGGLVAAAFWLVVGWLALHGELARGGASPAPARA